MPADLRLATGELLTAKAWELRRPFVEWIAELGRSYGNSLLWWMSNFPEKNIDDNDFFLNLCYLEIAEETIKSSSSGICIIVEDWALGVTLRKALRKAGLPNRILGAVWLWHLGGVAREIFTFGRRWFSGLLLLARQYWAARRTRHLQVPPLPPARVPRVLLHTCVDDACINDDGHFRDRYFTELPAWLIEKGYDVVTLVWPHNLRGSYTAAFSWFRRNQQKFLIPEDYFRLRDYFKAMVIMLRQLWVPAGSTGFTGKDILPLVWREHLRQASAVGKVRFFLYGPMIQRLKQLGWRIDYYLDMFENMSIEKPIAQAIHTHYPEAAILGFQHAPICPFTLAYTVGQGELAGARQVFPDRLVSLGQFFLEILAADGFPQAFLRLGPALRYLYLYDETKLPLTKKDSEKVILITLPLALEAAVEILNLVPQMLEEFSCRVAIKPHPMMDRHRLLKAGKIDASFKPVIWADGDMSSWLTQSICVIGTATAAILEALAYWVPVVVIGRQVGLDMNYYAWWQQDIKMFRSLSGPNEVLEAVRYWVELSDEERQVHVEVARAFLCRCFQPWDEDLLSGIFHHDEPVL